jgi:uncharacterized C2H2 Zn-finger protein
MQCPRCGARMNDVTETWHTFTEAEGAEYLAAYVSIWYCPKCDTVAGAQNETIEWVMEPEAALEED